VIPAHETPIPPTRRRLPRVLVTGSRAWPYPSGVRMALSTVWRGLGMPIRVVHGACPTGADLTAADWATEHSCAYIEQERHPADWASHGHAAGPIRNAEMVKAGAVICLAFPHGDSRGTRGCMKLAADAGIPVWEAADGYGPRELEQMVAAIRERAA
jgi:hypothetical protein